MHLTTHEEIELIRRHAARFLQNRRIEKVGAGLEHANTFTSGSHLPRQCGGHRRLSLPRGRGRNPNRATRVHTKDPFCLHREKGSRGSYTRTAFSAEGHGSIGARVDILAWKRATRSRERWFSPSQGLCPSGVTRAFFSLTVAGPRRIHTGFPIQKQRAPDSRSYSIFRTRCTLEIPWMTVKGRPATVIPDR